MNGKERRDSWFQRLPCPNDPLGHDIGARKRAAEVDYETLDSGIGQHEIERHLRLRIGLPTYLEEICGPPPKMIDDIHRRHR